MTVRESDGTNFSSVVDGSPIPDPDDVALIEWTTDEHVTYEELADRVDRAAGALRALGVDPRDRVVLAFPNEVRYLYAFLGAMRIGAVPVPLNIKLADDKIAYVCRDADAQLAVTSADPNVSESVLPVLDADDDSSIAEFAVAGASPDTLPDADRPVHSFDMAMDRASPVEDPVPVDPDHPAMHPYTSGSTGRPKGVVLTHGGVRWNTDALAKAWMLDGEDRGIAATPLYHKNAMPGVKALLDRGGSVVVMPGFDAEDVLAAIDRHGITFITGVPAMFKLLCNKADSAAYDLSSLEFAVCGSAPVSEELAERFTGQFGAVLLESYGLTEGGPVVSVSPRWGVTKVGSTGLALPDTETVVVDPETLEPLEPGEVGELLVSNPGVGRYHDRPDANEEAFVEKDGIEFLRTGDLARKDADGYHYIVGRIDDMMIVGGENVYPAEVEDLLLGHPGVGDAAVVAADHSVKGEAPVAFVVRRPDADVTPGELKSYAIDNGPAYAHPRRVFLVKELPLTGTEKIDRRELEDMASDRIDGAL